MTEHQKAPKTMDWVKARAECSIDSLVLMLREVVKADAKAADRRGGERTQFKYIETSEAAFLIERQRIGHGFVEGEAVGFERTDAGIVVSRLDPKTRAQMFIAAPYVDPITGDCKFSVEGQPLEAWQVSQRALEKLFFEFGLSAKPSGGI